MFFAGCSEKVQKPPPAPAGGEARILPAWSAVRDDAALKAVFRGGETMPARLMGPGAVAMPVDFSGEAPPARANWDLRLKCDLSDADGLQFDFYCDDLGLFSSFSCYFRSGDGWYHGTFCPEEPGAWQRVTVMKSEVEIEGRVAGWDCISTVRISGWRAGTGKTDCGIANLAAAGGGRPDAVVVFAESLALDGGAEARKCMRYAERMCSALRSLGLAAAFVPDRALSASVATNAAMVVMPYNPRFPDDRLDALRLCATGGVRLVACNAQSGAVAGIPGVKIVNDQRLGGTGAVDLPFLRSLVLDAAPSLAEKMKRRDEEERRRAAELREWLSKRPSKKGERRAFWCHSARGLGGAMDWEEAVKFLRRCGFNAIHPNLCWAGTAFYQSDVLPMSPDVAKRGDAFVQCGEACRRHGVEMHVWKVCWNMGHHASAAFVRKMRDAGRTQKDWKGESKDLWLCPSHPENQKLEIDALVELAKKRPDGIHLDYIRYPGLECCFCEGCRVRFEEFLGGMVDDWPAAARDEKRLKGRWNEFRIECITKVVRQVSERVRKEAPGVKISAALFGNPSSAAASVAQNWPEWCREGLLDFACHMDYVSATPLFRSQVSAQMKAAGKTPLYPGIGLSCWPNDGRDAERLAKQIQTVRDLGLGGFTVFNFDRRALHAMPLMRLGVTKDD